MSQASIFRSNSVAVAVSNQVSCELDGDVIILNLKDGQYYELNSVAGRIWSLIQHPKTLGEVRDIILEEYDVGREECETDIQELCDRMAEKSLVELHG